jgi:hypothetical protein
MFRYFSLIALIIILSSCSGTPAPVLDFSVADTVANWVSGKAALDAKFYADKEASVVSGSINAAGGFKAKLNSSLDTSLLEPLATCEGLSVSSNALRMNQLSAFTVLKNSKDLGLIAQVSSESVMKDGLVRLGDYYVQYIYANITASVQGECPLGGVPGIFRFDLKLKKGWNVAVFSLIAEDKGVQTLELASKTVPAGASWVFGD